jgi:uncharacterized protein (DUF885 family)
MPFNFVLFRRLGMAVESALPVIITIGFVVSLIPPALAQSDPDQQDLSSVLKSLSEQITKADQVVARLRDTAKKGPVEAQLEVTKAATALGQLADRLGDQGDILSQLRAVRNTAQVHRDRVGGDHRSAGPTGRHLGGIAGGLL